MMPNSFRAATFASMIGWGFRLTRELKTLREDLLRRDQYAASTNFDRHVVSNFGIFNS